MSLFGSVGSVQSSDFSHGLFKVSSPPGGITFSGVVNKYGIQPQWTFGTYSFFAGGTVDVFLPGGQDYDLRLSIVDPSQNFSILQFSNPGSQGLTGTADMRDFEDSLGVILTNNTINEIRFPETDRDYSVQMDTNDIQGVVDMTMVNNLFSYCRFAYNPGLTGIYHTSSSRPITNYSLHNCDLEGELVLPFSDIGGNFRVQMNPNLSKITHSPTDRQFTIYYAFSAGLQGVHDMSMITGFPEKFRIGDNIGLTGLSHTYSNTIITEYWANSSGLEGVLDLTMFPNLKGGVLLSGNLNLTGIQHTASNQVFDYYLANVCDLTGTLDFSMFPNFGGEIRLQTNPNLTEITHTFSAVNFTGYNASGCSLIGPRVDMLSNLTAATAGPMLWNWSDNNMGVTAVNQLLVDIDTVSVTASVTKTINVGGTNAAPTSGPPDGDAAVTSLLTKGYTVITS